MKKRTFAMLLSTTLALSILAGCGKTQEVDSSIPVESTDTFPTEETDTETEQTNTETAEATEAETETTIIDYDSMYRSELTNEWIDKALENQRPIAVLVDNEITALDHYGLTQADIVYEIMNSTANGEITRFMAIVKDWNNITRFGSIRSARPTNFMIAPEYDAVLVHDGGPFYINSYLSNPWIDNLSGGFARIDNGKPREFTEYVTTGEIASRMKSAGYSTEYTSYYPGQHWIFAEESELVTLSNATDSMDCTLVDLPFPHNKSELEYDLTTDTYLYYEYGQAHIDPENDDKHLAFTNVLLQCADYTRLDTNGYMQFNLINESGKGYYITGGSAIPVTWEKGTDTELTQFYDASGQEIVLNTGKTYIALVATDRWDELVIQ